MRSFRQCPVCSQWSWREGPGGTDDHAGCPRDFPAGGGAPKLRPGRLGAAPLDASLLGQPVTADVYARNAFRLLGLPACAGEAETESARQSFANLLRLDAGAALESGILTGYDAAVDIGDLAECVDRLDDPRGRFVCEVFWPHLPDGGFRRIRDERRLPEGESLSALEREAATGEGPGSDLAAHAAAVSHHSLALAREFGFLAGDREWDGVPWGRALEWWARTWGADSFWRYMERRVEAWDDPRLTVADVEEARLQLPRLLLAFHVHLARTYAFHGAHRECRLHLDLIRGSAFDEDTRRWALAATAQSIVDARLQDLADRLGGDSDPGRKLSRSEADRSCGPALGGALELKRLLGETLALPEPVVADCRFDPLCEPLSELIGKKLDYRGESGPRPVLWNLLLTRRMLRLPLSDALRRRLELAAHSHLEILYPVALPPGDLDPTLCWFLGGDEADADASVEMPVYRITKKSGPSVEWEKRMVLVPRSVLARDFHQGRVTQADLAARNPSAEERAMLDEIAGIERGAALEAARIRAEADAAIEAERGALAATLAAHDERWRERKAADKQTLLRVRTEHGRRVEVAKEMHGRRIHAVKQRQAPRIAEAQEVFEREVAATKGPRAWIRLEAPAIGGGAVGAGLLGLALPSVGRGGIVGAIVPVAALAACGALLAAGVARRARIRQHEAHAAARDAVLAAWTEEAAAVDADLQRATDASAQRMRSEGSDADASLKRMVADRKALEDAAAGRIAKLEGDAKSAIDRAKREQVARTEPLRQRLGSRRRVRPQGDAAQFPPYVRLLASGYEAGTGPSQQEVDAIVKREVQRFMDSLDPLEQAALALTMRQLPQAMFAELLGKLMAMDRRERRRVLGTLSVGRPLP